MSVSPGDHARVRELLGREPQGRYEIVVRDETGDPVVLRNDPFLSDGTPMPTTYWLVGPDEIRRVGQLEADGGVDRSEREVDAAELAAAHERYATERDAMIADDHTGPRPSGGVGGTRVGVKCLHAHWAWHLAGGDDPIGRWIAEQLSPSSMTVRVDAGSTTIGFGPTDLVVPWGADSLTSAWLADHDPPRPDELTNALGAVTDHIDDLVRVHPDVIQSSSVTFGGDTIRSLVRLELGHDDPPAELELDRSVAEELFRLVATESSHDRASNPGLPSEHVGSIVATCCIVVSIMRRLYLERVVLAAG